MPYYLGHEREDVVAHREEFVDHFLRKREEYFTISDENEWIVPVDKQRVIIFHDESTFKSGEALSKRWIKNSIEEPFNLMKHCFNKGKTGYLKI